MGNEIRAPCLPFHCHLFLAGVTERRRGRGRRLDEQSGRVGKEGV